MPALEKLAAADAFRSSDHDPLIVAVKLVPDLDGDGEYEIVVKWDPSNAKDNSQSGYTGNVFIDAYEMNGTRLWRIDLGRNIRAGAHYTQFMVYDLDGDGIADRGWCGIGSVKSNIGHTQAAAGAAGAARP